jgi:ABC-type sugar transport system substrate-binding protein
MWTVVTRTVALAGVLALVAACSSSGTAGTSHLSAGAVDSGLTLADAAIAKYAAAPTTLGLTDALKSKPTGKRIYEIEFPGPVGQVLGDSVVAACKPLGCDVTRVPMGADPASQSAAWDRAVRDKPDAVVSAGVTTAVAGKQMRQLRAEGVKVVVFISDAVQGSDVDVNLAGPDRMKFDGTLEADWIASTSKGKAQVLAYDFPDLPYVSAWTTGVKGELARVCPACTVAVDHYGFAIANNFAGRVVSYLQQHPDIDYIAMSYGDEMVGLQQALQAAGLASKVKIVGRAGTSLNYGLIKGGSAQKADIGFPVQMFSWGLVDAAARLLAGQDASVPYAQLTQVLTYATIIFDVKSTPSWYGVKDFQHEFETSWGVSG